MKSMYLGMISAALASLSGCASVKPYIVCELGTGKAVVQQGIAGIGVGQELKDADSLCANLKSSPTANLSSTSKP